MRRRRGFDYRRVKSRSKQKLGSSKGVRELRFTCVLHYYSSQQSDGGRDGRRPGPPVVDLLLCCRSCPGRVIRARIATGSLSFMGPAASRRLKQSIALPKL